MQTPLYETSDDPRVYRREQQRAASGRVLIELLTRATGACFPREAVVIDDYADGRERVLAHFASIAREGRAAWAERWQPSKLLLRALDKRGLSWADVEARL
jgi:hypothetical protein